jgi:hypothetical protein
MNQRNAQSLASLRAVTSMIREVELAKLNERNLAVAALRDALAELERSGQRHQAASGVAGEIDPASRAGHDRVWQDWKRNEARRLNGLLAETLSHREAQLVNARTAFSRNQAVENLTRRAATTKRSGQ